MYECATSHFILGVGGGGGCTSVQPHISDGSKMSK